MLKQADAAGSFTEAMTVAGIKISKSQDRLANFAVDTSGRRGAIPIAIVHPLDTDQLQKVVQCAASASVPLIAVSSSAGPRRRGDTISDKPCVIVDMTGMSRIIHIDEADVIALIEAGVTFPAFAAALEPYGLRPYQPLMPRASKSVLTAFLEREPTTVPGKHWDSADPLGAMEVVFGTGDVFRTGGASIPGKIEDSIALGNRHMFSLGPSQLDLGRVMQGSQGALGIVVWSSIYVQRIPALETAFFVASDDIEPLTDLCYKMLRRRTDGQLFIMNNIQLALMLADTPEEYTALKASLPRWTAYVELVASSYFSEESMAYQRDLLDTDAAQLGLVLSPDLAGRKATALAPRQRAYSDQPPSERAGLVDHELFFMTQLDQAAKYDLLVDERAPDFDRGVYVQPMTQGVNAHCQFTYLGKSGQEAALVAIVRDAAERCAAAGAFFSRPYHPWADLSFSHDGLIEPMLAKTKNAFDPDNILQPGALSLGAAA